jgi:hypothetical protein
MRRPGLFAVCLIMGITGLAVSAYSVRTGNAGMAGLFGLLAGGAFGMCVGLATGTKHLPQDHPEVIARLTAERDHWRAKHNSQVEIKEAVPARPDLVQQLTDAREGDKGELELMRERAGRDE